MKIIITGRNYKVSEHLQEITQQKFSKLEKYFEGKDVEVKVCYKKEATTLVAEAMLDYCGKFVRATASGENAYDNLDVILPKIEGQIRKYRTRFDKSHKNSAYTLKADFDGDARYENSKLNIVKEKKFTLTPMTVKEAMEEMELLGHNFYVFLEAKSNTVQVLYLRNDGDLGLIEPQF